MGLRGRQEFCLARDHSQVLSPVLGGGEEGRQGRGKAEEGRKKEGGRDLAGKDVHECRGNEESWGQPDREFSTNRTYKETEQQGISRKKKTF